MTGEESLVVHLREENAALHRQLEQSEKTVAELRQQLAGVLEQLATWIDLCWRLCYSFAKADGRTGSAWAFAASKRLYLRGEEHS